MLFPVSPGEIIQADSINALSTAAAWFSEDTGTQNAFQLTFDGSGTNSNQITTLTNGQVVSFVAATSNSGDSTIQVNGLTAVPLTKHGSDPLSSGDIVAGQIVMAIYNADQSRFELLGSNSSNHFADRVFGEAGFQCDTLFYDKNAAFYHSEPGNTIILNPENATILSAIGTLGSGYPFIGAFCYKSATLDASAMARSGPDLQPALLYVDDSTEFHFAFGEAGDSDTDITFTDALTINESGMKVCGFGLNVTPAAPQTGGPATASSSYTSTEQAMLQTVYDALRTFGFLS